MPNAVATLAETNIVIEMFMRNSIHAFLWNMLCLAVSRKLPDLGSFQVGDSMLGRLYFNLQWYLC